MMTKEKFIKKFRSLTETQRRAYFEMFNDIYSWNVMYFEIRNNTKLGKKILKEMKLRGQLE